jgi:hypothetical protein
MSRENRDDKYSITIEFTNKALNSTIAVWNSSGYNSTIDNSSMDLTTVYPIDNVSIIKFQFNTTDGKQHTANVSDNRTTGSIVVLDIDNVSVA